VPDELYDKSMYFCIVVLPDASFYANPPSKAAKFDLFLVPAKEVEIRFCCHSSRESHTYAIFASVYVNPRFFPPGVIMSDIPAA